MRKTISTLSLAFTLFIGANLAFAEHLGGSYAVIPTYSSYTYTTDCNTYRYDPYYKISTIIATTCINYSTNNFGYNYNTNYNNGYYNNTNYSTNYTYPTYYSNSYNGVSNYSPYDNYNYGYNDYNTNYNTGYTNGYYNNTYYSSPSYQYWYNYSNGYPTSIQNVAAPITNWNTNSYGNNNSCYYNSWGNYVCY